MKFSIVVNVTTDKKGLELEEEYDRLGFEDSPKARPERFPNKSLTFPVDKAFAKEHRTLFEDGSLARVTIASCHTTAADWEDWGSVGMMLSQENFSLERALKVHYGS